MTPNDDARTGRGSHFGPARPRPGHSASPRPAARPSARPAAPGRVRTGVTAGRVSSRTAAATRRAAGGPSRHRRGRRAPERGSRSRVAVVVAALVAVVLVAAAAVAVVTRFSASESPSQSVPAGTQVTLTIPDGSGASAVAQVLYDNGVISDKSEFLSQVRRTEAESALKSGTYSLTAGMDLSELIDQLTLGPNASTAQVTVPEGYSVQRTAQAVEEALGIPADDFLAQAKASNYVADFPFLSAAGEDSLEGYLFPKTYDFSDLDEVTADDVIRAMLSQYQTELANAGIDMAAAAASLSERYGITVTDHDIVTLASLVEREALTDDERPNVASVFYNRLAQGMRLQSDATLAYSLGREVTADDLTVDDPYNTYTRDGLTPTPICSPGLASIQAAVSPADTDYLFFFIQDGYSVFSRTNDEHEQAIANRPQ